MRYSQLRFKPAIQFVLFLTTVGLLAFFGEVGLWVWFWSALSLSGLAYFVLTYLDSAAFAGRLNDLRAAEFRLASIFERVGATGLFLMADPRQQMERNTTTRSILADGNRFGLATLTAASYVDPAVDRHWSAVQARLDAGCPLRLLLQDPLCAEKRVRDKRNEQDGHEQKLDLVSAIRLVERYPHVQVRFTAVNLYAAVFFSERSLTYDPYHLGKSGPRIENRFITVVYDNLGPGADPAYHHYALLVSHFDYLWSELGQDISRYLSAHRDELARICSPAVLARVDGFLAGKQS